MERLTGLFLGAGASLEAGMPLVWDLTAEIKSWLTPEKLRELNAGWRLQGTGHSDAVIDDLASFLGRPEVHYEAILGHLEIQFRRHRGLSQEYHGLYSWFVELVYRILYIRHVKNDEFLDRNLPRYDGLKALADANTPLWIFSLNHDVIVEAIAARSSIPLHTGFSKSTITLPRRGPDGTKIGEIKAEILSKDELENHAMNFPNPPEPGIYLLKIHGALDVFTFNDGKDLLKLLPDAPGHRGVTDILCSANEDLFYLLPGAPGGRVKATNEIAYADEQGEMQFLRRSLLAGAFKFDPRGQQVLPMHMLKHFEQNLNFVSKLVCIGYGFGDLHINAILREWLGFTQDRQLEIVNPGADEVPAFLLHLISQVVITKCDTTEYLDKQADIVRSPKEQLEKRLASIARKLGRERFAEGIASFAAREQGRMSETLIARLQSLPTKDGQPDFSSVGDVRALAKQWATEAQLSEEGRLEQLIDHFSKETPQ